MKRKIINIDENRCNGCGVCIPNCPEGAIQIIDNKARLVSELCCDGLGACLGHCPQGAISIEEREAQPYDEKKVMENIIKQGPNVIKAHLKHLKDHDEKKYLEEALDSLKEHGMEIEWENSGCETGSKISGGCPGSKVMNFTAKENSNETGERVSHLTHWPVQLHLISPNSSHYRRSDLLLCADCVPFSIGDFHKHYLKGKTLAIACPKLDDGQQIYLDKLTALIDIAKVNTITVMIMQVPCCTGLLNLAQKAADSANRKVPVRCIVISTQGEIVSDKWV